MALRNLLEAVSDALRIAVTADPSVVLLGEDAGGDPAGVFGATRGLADRAGGRCIPTDGVEGTLLGLAVGLSLYGMRPVAEVPFADFLTAGFDQLVDEAATLRYRTAGRWPCSLVVRAPYGAGTRGGPLQSRSVEAWLAHAPGLKVVAPATPRDAKGLLLAAIADPDPVVFLEPKRLYHARKEEVPDGHFTEPLGRARIAREGDDVTVIAWGAMVDTALQAAERAHDLGEYACEVIDLRTLSPLDMDAVLGSVRKTGRAIVVHEASRTAGLGAEIVARIADETLEYLEAPVLRVCGPDTPVPVAGEDAWLVGADAVVQAVERVVSF